MYTQQTRIMGIEARCSGIHCRNEAVLTSLTGVFANRWATYCYITAYGKTEIIKFEYFY
jgi:hypothetical protein